MVRKLCLSILGLIGSLQQRYSVIHVKMINISYVVQFSKIKSKLLNLREMMSIMHLNLIEKKEGCQPQPYTKLETRSYDTITLLLNYLAATGCHRGIIGSRG